MIKNLKMLFVLALIMGIFKQINAQVPESTPINGLFSDNGTINKDPIPYPTIREADVMWRKTVWREIDFRQKINLAFYNPKEPHNNWKNFITIIMDALKNGEITAYDPIQTDEFEIPITYEDFITKQQDTIYDTYTNPNPPYDQVDTVYIKEFQPSKVLRLRLKEVWYFDKQRSQMLVRIIGLCPVQIVERGGEEVTEPLFWIYYPEARPIMAKSLVFNRKNAAQRRTYDEVFWKRMFASYVYKVDNVYDRRISEYATGVDALLESERVKNEIMEFEFDLWEY